MAEVVIKNVPEQANENSVVNYLQPVLSRLSIQTFRCQKMGKKLAVLTFLHKEDAHKFLHWDSCFVLQCTKFNQDSQWSSE
jgi:hypothetical protein